MSLSVNDIKALVSACHKTPYEVLGLNADQNTRYLRITCYFPHLNDIDAVEIMALAPNKKSAQLNSNEQIKSLGKLVKVHHSGLYSLKLRRKKLFTYKLKLTSANASWLIDDPYQFSATLGELDIYLLQQGNHQKPYEKLGAHLQNKPLNGQKIQGVSFAVWAPNASHVSLLGDFNHWDERSHAMQNITLGDVASGYWNIFIPQASVGQQYKYAIKDKNGNTLPFKADPYGNQAQYRPDTASIISAKDNYLWQDQDWLDKREKRNSRNAAISIYEVHLGSWRRDKNNEFLNYRQIADQLIPYTLSMGFTHIQLMPVSEFPFDGSWGYQPVGLFAPTARFGNEADFQYFVDACHQANLGLLIDWVPGHFPSDDHGLATFDGTHLFEHEDPRQGYHPDWNTLIYNYERVEVANFLRASALHWLDKYHVDGIRVDAVASMLYLDYSRKENEWIPNIHGGRENLAAVDFLKRFNEELYQQYPGTFSVAEESTSWPGVSRATHDGGLGFGYKWNMGWMNDSLQYMQRESVHRCHHHNELSFSLVYAFDENFILPLSHDEVVHGKGSILQKMPGDDAWQQFANIRAYYSFMWAHPGKKLLFMGCEFAQGKEWDHDHELDWHQLDVHWHSGVQRLIKALNKVYCNTPAFYEKDCQSEGFSWLDHQNSEQSIYSFIRFGNDAQENAVVVVCNFTSQTHHNVKLGVPKSGEYVELLNSDAEIYGGSNTLNLGILPSVELAWQGQQHYIDITVPPLATAMFILKDVRLPLEGK
ncbi:1,4-alpha-glucan branching protein GlgB [Colwellia sp. BRX10-9]|uniref:1,4-alpha-glucan branching protein GlgB n=1 Tax=Colwellia sp. BRX10-9 TaxID=2759839 RepID=UPI0015F54438|nr:1,4-alpha-glucan branching protein GlgB [Colwellia sp. BRX10-9]MBA6383239.1 1,4-alpha-glucan branching protein GlgB [Colwellia sp. BRX10-9]